MAENNIDFVEVMDTWFKNRTDGMHTCIPGKILKYYGHEKRKAKVEPMVKIRTVHNKLIKIEPIDGVPVIFPSSGKFSMLFPLSEGDGCELRFSESSIGNFLNSTGDVVDADDIRRFNLSDCICTPGLWSFNKIPFVPENDNDFFLSFEDAIIKITKTTNLISFKDKDGNKFETTQTGMAVKDKNGNEIDMNTTGMTLKDKNTNEIVMGIASTKINDNLEVLL